MSSHLSYEPLGALAQVSGGRRLPAGKRLQLQDNGAPYLRIVDIKNSRVERSGLNFVPSTVQASLDRYRIFSGDIFISIVGSTGLVSKIPTDLDGVFLTENAARIRPNSLLIDEDYLYYYLRTAEGQAELDSRTVGTTQKKLALSRLNEVRIPMRTAEEQRAIGSILRALDRKIDVGVRLSQTANLLAESIFLLALQNQSVPVQIRDVATHRPGKHLARDRYAEGGPYPVYGSNTYMGSHSEALYSGPFSVLARIGSNCGKLTWSEGDAWVNNNASALIAKENVDPWILRFALEQINMDQFRSGSGQPFISAGDLLDSTMELPANVDGLGKKLRALSTMIDRTRRQSHALQITIDFLLPLLFSGDLRVNTDRNLPVDP